MKAESAVSVNFDMKYFDRMQECKTDFFQFCYDNRIEKFRAENPCRIDFSVFQIVQTFFNTVIDVFYQIFWKNIAQYSFPEGCEMFRGCFSFAHGEFRADHNKIGAHVSAYATEFLNGVESNTHQQKNESSACKTVYESVPVRFTEKSEPLQNNHSFSPYFTGFVSGFIFVFAIYILYTEISNFVNEFFDWISNRKGGSTWRKSAAENAAAESPRKRNE